MTVADLGIPCPNCGEEPTGVYGLYDAWETTCCGATLDLGLNPIREGDSE